MAIRGYSSKRHTAEWRAARNSFELELSKELKKVTTRTIRTASTVCNDFTASLGKRKEIPIYTGNLLDSTGAAMYHRGRIVVLRLPAQTATSPQRAKGRKSIWGTKEFIEMRNDGLSRFPRGLVCVLYSAVPYAKLVNTRGAVRTKDIGNWETKVKHRKGKPSLLVKTGKWIPKRVTRGIGYFNVLANDFNEKLVTALIADMKKAQTTRRKTK